MSVIGLGNHGITWRAEEFKMLIERTPNIKRTSNVKRISNIIENFDGATFVERYGHVKYTKKLRNKGYSTDWKTTCELCNQDITQYEHYRSKNSPCLDHCRIHGWVRGIVCQHCNVKKIARYIPWSKRVDLVLRNYLLQCPDCCYAYTKFPILDTPPNKELTIIDGPFISFEQSNNSERWEKLVNNAIKSLVNGDNGWANTQYVSEINDQLNIIYIKVYDCDDVGYMFTTFYLMIPCNNCGKTSQVYSDGSCITCHSFYDRYGRLPHKK
jgi:Recombination endonuclease VII